MTSEFPRNLWVSLGLAAGCGTPGSRLEAVVTAHRAGDHAEARRQADKAVARWPDASEAIAADAWAAASSLQEAASAVELAAWERAAAAFADADRRVSRLNQQTPLAGLFLDHPTTSPSRRPLGPRTTRLWLDG